MRAQPTRELARGTFGRSVGADQVQAITTLMNLRDALAAGEVSPVQAVVELTTLLTHLLTSTPEIPARTVAPAYSWKQLRQERGWSQREVYRRLTKLAAVRGSRLPDWPVVKRNISRWENSTVATVSPFYLDLLGSLFNLPVRNVAGDSSEVAA